MTHNDVLRSMRYILNVNDAKLIAIVGLAGCDLSKEEMTSFLKKEDEEGYNECSQQIMASFLNGLVLYKRGKDESKPPQALEVPVTNNTILKKVRVAFELKDNDIVAIIEKSELKLSKTELSAFFRKKGHRNYRECGDQFLRTLLKGLAAH